MPFRAAAGGLILVAYARDIAFAAIQGFDKTMEPRLLNEELGIPEHFVPVGVIPVGKPLRDKRSSSLKRGWRPLDDFARWETWGEV